MLLTSLVYKIQHFQNQAACIISTDFDYGHFGLSTVQTLGLLMVSERRDYLILIIVCKCLYNLVPHYLGDLFVC